MARLKPPKIAYRDTSPRRKDDLWHLSISGPIMKCGRFIYKEDREAREIKSIPASELCCLCTGPMEVTDD